MKKQPKKQRGRKPGDGILKELDASQGPWDTAYRLAFGRHDDWFGNMARLARHMPKIIERLDHWGKKLAGKPSAKNYEAFQRYLADKEQLQRTADSFGSQFRGRAADALRRGDSRWFKKMADAIDGAAVTANTYKLHSAIWKIVAGHRVNFDEIFSTPRPHFGEHQANSIRSLTIGELCVELAKEGHKAAPNAEEGDFRRTVRRACRALGICLKPGKPGRPRQTN
jgi:hypothetical protein